MTMSNKAKVVSMLIAGYVSVLLLSGLLLPNPRMIAPLGMFLGILAFYLIYSGVPKKNLLLDVYLFLTTFLGSSLGSLLLSLACRFVEKPICTSNLLRAQIFGNFAFPLMVIIILWLTQRLPVILKRNG